MRKISLFTINISSYSFIIAGHIEYSSGLLHKKSNQKAGIECITPAIFLFKEEVVPNIYSNDEVPMCPPDLKPSCA